MNCANKAYLFDIYQSFWFAKIFSVNATEMTFHKSSYYIWPIFSVFVISWSRMFPFLRVTSLNDVIAGISNLLTRTCQRAIDSPAVKTRCGPFLWRGKREQNRSRAVDWASGSTPFCCWLSCSRCVSLIIRSTVILTTPDSSYYSTPSWTAFIHNLWTWTPHHRPAIRHSNHSDPPDYGACLQSFGSSAKENEQWNRNTLDLFHSATLGRRSDFIDFCLVLYSRGGRFPPNRFQPWACVKSTNARSYFKSKSDQ